MAHSTHKEVDLLSDAKRCYDTLPEEEKRGSKGKMLTSVINKLIAVGELTPVITAVDNFYQLNTLEKHLEKVKAILAEDNTAADCKDAILRVYNYLNEHCPKLKELIWKGIVKEQITKKMILDKMNTSYQLEVENKISGCMWASVAVVVIQLFQLGNAWYTVEKASNVIKDPNKFATINENLGQMETMANKFLGLCERTPNRDDVLEAVMLFWNFEGLYNSTLTEIDHLRVDINGHIQHLYLRASSTTVNGLSNVANVAAWAIHIWEGWSSLTSASRALGTAMIAIFTGLAFGNYTVYHLTQESLINLRKTLEEANRLRAVIEDLHKQVLPQIEKLRSKNRKQ